MANEEHVAILKQGVEVWNQWRKEYPKIVADLRDADLHRMDLGGADLREVDLRWSDLFSVDLGRANLRWANLFRADLHGADLFRADLSEADLREAELSNVRLGYTIFGNVNLSQVKGLETIKHNGPSYIDIQTIYRSGGNIPEVFMRGAGIPNNFIVYMKSLTGQTIDFYSCFISHSSKDEEFAERLYADLQNNGVRCWYAPEDLVIGEPFLSGIDRGIRLHDKLLLILSEHSVSSRWVEHEVLSATTKEYEQARGSTVLFPIRLDNAIMDTDIPWAKTLKGTRHIGDFTRWKDYDSYKKAFDKLLQDLKGKK